MKNRYLIHFVGIVLTFSCCNLLNYERRMALPEGVETISSDKLCSFSVYELIEHRLEAKKEISIQEFTEGLICEGYSQNTMKLTWSKIEDLSIEDKNSLSYFFEKINSCGVEIERDFYVAACRNLYDNSNTYNYYRLYFLNKQKSVLLEVVNLDG